MPVSTAPLLNTKPWTCPEPSIAFIPLSQITNHKKGGRTFQNLVSIVPLFNASGGLTKFLGLAAGTDDKQRDGAGGNKLLRSLSLDKCVRHLLA